MDERSEEQRLRTADLVARHDQPGPTDTRADGTGDEDDTLPAGGETAPLFPEQEVRDLRSQWEAIQTGFVDEPRQAVERADGLVAQVIQRLAETFSEEHGRLEQQ
jgi:hypothetical protein